MDVRKILKRLVNIAMLSLENDTILEKMHFTNTPYFELYGETAEAIYEIIGEHTMTFEESVTYEALNSGYSKEMAVNMLMEAYEKNHK